MGKIKKLIFGIATVILMMTVLCFGASAAYTDGYYTYEVTDGAATITDVDTSISGEVVIPDTLGGYSVTRIGSSAFYNCTSLASITIPDSVTSIGSSAFSGCTSLESITIPDSVTSIGSGAFYNTAYYTDETNWENNVLYIVNHLIKANTLISGDYEIKEGTKCIADSAFCWCTSLTSITIPDSVTSIGNYAFDDCTSLESITIPDSVTSIGSSAFRDCTNLTSITVDENNEYYSSDEYGVLFNKDKTELIQCPIGNTRASYTIPDSVTSIGSGAFWWCTSLESITIPDSVTSIGDYAFEDCTSLTSVTIPDSVTSIGFYAFYNTAYYDDETNWEDNVLYIGKHLIEANTSISGDYEIKDGTKCIADSAFCWCTSLTSITIPDSVTSIGNCAFDECTSLESITIPDSVTSIGWYAFYNCTSLTSITVDENNEYYSSDEYGVLFNKDRTELIRYPIGNTRASYTIPDSATSIGDYAFYYCTSLESVTIGNSVTSIGYGAFYYCTSLESVTIGNSVTSIGSGAFYNSTSLTNAHYDGTQEEWDAVSVSSYNTYLTDIIHMATDESGDGICDLCDCEIDDDNDVTGHTHSYTSTVTPATCTADGYITYSCTCGDSYKETIPSTGHSYVSSVTAATCTADGYTTYTCHCGDNYTETIPSTGHSYISSVTAPTCTENGYTTYTCSVCSDTYTADKVSATGHSYVSSVTAPTCTADGYTTYTCACGDTYTETIPSTGHSYVSSVTAATCTENGYTTYTCSVCNDTYTADNVSATGHTYVSSVTAATCTENGYTTYTCSACNDSYTANQVPATGHGDANADGSCDNCGFDMTEGCDCNCHKEGFAGFIWKFLEFFYKLFKTKTYCECGMIHY